MTTKCSQEAFQCEPSAYLRPVTWNFGISFAESYIGDELKSLDYFAESGIYPPETKDGDDLGFNFSVIY